MWTIYKYTLSRELEEKEREQVINYFSSIAGSTAKVAGDSAKILKVNSRFVKEVTHYYNSMQSLADNPKAHLKFYQEDPRVYYFCINLSLDFTKNLLKNHPKLRRLGLKEPDLRILEKINKGLSKILDEYNVKYLLEKEEKEVLEWAAEEKD